MRRHRLPELDDANPPAAFLLRHVVTITLLVILVVLLLGGWIIQEFLPLDVLFGTATDRPASPFDG